ncbi:zinc finger MYM-type protein 1 [Artemisia annua]|uniref:Zinc finger MYM-type protein 1 n=1 Tax=Artemisia annua TaxID=35608 RepID=A0A2U1L4D7_ARTAN|nr:zinc finger MYM-type protein 1 [Artemisia annua]
MGLKKKFLKLKLLKSYLRSTMSQERLNGLASIAIENDILESVNYEMLIDNFATKNAKRMTLFKNKLIGEVVVAIVAGSGVASSGGAWCVVALCWVTSSGASGWFAVWCCGVGWLQCGLRGVA